MKLPKDQLAETNDLNPILTEMEANLNDLKEEIDSKIEMEDIPAFPSEITVSNLPEVQRVEITNLPEKDDSEQVQTLKDIKEAIATFSSKDVNLAQVESLLSELIQMSSSEEEIDLRPKFDELKAILTTLNDNVSSIETPAPFDYLKLAQIIRENVKIRGGGGSAGVEYIKNTQGTAINPMEQPTYYNGELAQLQATGEGHLEVAIHSPRLPFGSIHTEKLAPIFQSDGVYGINTFSMLTSTGLAVGTGSGSGSVTTSGNKLVCSTGTTQYSFASLQSRRRLRYKAGQGVVGRFAALFSTPVASGVQVAGFGTAETTLAFGYNGTTFGILYSNGGVREIHTFTVTTASTATNNYVVTLPNTATVNVTATNNGSTTQTAYEISKGTFPGWKASARGSTVIFVADSTGNKSGSFSLAQTGAATPAAGSDAETVTGASTTDTWIPQTTWNGDKLDGTGASGVTLDPSKGNVYQIGIQYLGFGAIVFQVETATSNSNNPEFVTVHTIKYPNTSTNVSLSQPSFPFLAAASSAGSTTDISVSVGSFAGFNEGEQINLGPRVSHQLDSTVTSSTSAFKPLFTIRNDREWKSRANQSVIHLLDVSGSANGNANATTKFYLVRDADLTGPVNFMTAGTNSCVYIDKAATGMSTPSDSQIVYTRSLATSSDFDYAFSDREITLQPGESMTVAVKSLTATAVCTGSLNTREDQ